MSISNASAKPLSHVEIVELIVKAQAGDLEARNRVVEANMRLVTKIASPIATAAGVKDQLQDLVQAGVFGLIEAIKRFDPARNKRFTTLATLWIRGEVRDAVENLQDVDVRGGRGHTWSRVRTIRDRLATELEREPTQREVKARCVLMGVEAPQDRILSRLELGRRFVDTDPDEIAGDESLERLIEVRDLFASAREVMVRALDPEDVRLLTLRYGLDGGDPLVFRQLREIFPGVDLDRWLKRVLTKLKDAL